MKQPSIRIENESENIWWNDGDAFRTRLFDAMSLLLPSGEQFVINAIADWLRASSQPDSKLPVLQQEAQQFIREEQSHQRAHRLYNNRLACHTPAGQLEQRIAAAIGEMADWDLHTRIAFAAAFEHMTALLSTEVMRTDNAWMGKGLTSQTRLWHWHCQEEIAHSHVAIGVSKAVGVGHARRVFAFLAAALYLCLDLAISLAVLCKDDIRTGRVTRWKMMTESAKFMFRAIPSLCRMAWGSVRYMAGAMPAR